MRRPYFLPLLVFAALLGAQSLPRPEEPDPATHRRLPNGKNQDEEILKSEHEKSLKDAAELQKLTEDFRSELEKNDRHVLSIGQLKKLDDMEKVIKRLRGRLKRY